MLDHPITEGTRTMTRTPEQGHTFQCLAKTMIAAIENQRDYLLDLARHPDTYPQSTLDFDFAIWAQDNGPRHQALDNLADGTSTCSCPPWEG